MFWGWMVGELGTGDLMLCQSISYATCYISIKHLVLILYILFKSTLVLNSYFLSNLFLSIKINIKYITWQPSISLLLLIIVYSHLYG